jgi:hypothetical protein
MAVVFQRCGDDCAEPLDRAFSVAVELQAAMVAVLPSHCFVPYRISSGRSF